MLKSNMIIIHYKKIKSDKILRISIILMINKLVIIKLKSISKESGEKLHIIIMKIKKRYKLIAKYPAIIKLNDGKSSNY